MPKSIDLAGRKYNMLTVIKELPERHVSPAGHKTKQYLCKCECGNTTIVLRPALTNKKNNTKSCGCHTNKTHEMSHQPEYQRWNSIKQRCYNPKHKAYANYGGRGITMYTEWKESFTKFKEDIGKPPFKNAHLDRIDNNKGYYPGNVRWVNSTVNCRNQTNTKLSLTKARQIREQANNKSKEELAVEYNVSVGTIYQVQNNLRWKENDETIQPIS